MSPPEKEFVYRARRGRTEIDPAIRRMVLGAAGVSALVILVALIWSGVHGPNFGPPPVVAPPPGPLRVVLADPGGLEVPGADVPIMSGEHSSAPAQLAAPQMAPDLSALNEAAGLVPGPPSSAPAGPAPAAQPAAPSAAFPSAAVTPPAASPPAATPSAPAAVPAAGSDGGSETMAQPPDDLTVVVQLAATADEQGAEREWNKLSKKYADLLGGKSPIIVAATVNGRQVWRLRVGWFASTDAAHEFCAALIARGAACAVANF